MTNFRKILVASALSLTCSSITACETEGDDGSVDDDLGFRGTALYNGLDIGNGLRLYNGMQLYNGVALSNGIAYSNGLSLQNGVAYSNGLDPNFGYMTTEAGRKLVKYLIECALPTGDSLTKGAYTFEGKVGLAPEWKYGACGLNCQEWVSACLLARVNEFGATVNIDMRASHAAVGTAPGAPVFSEQEGAFFGNLFANPPVAYACMGTNWANGQHLKRDCTTGSAGCLIKNVDYLTCDSQCYRTYGGTMLRCPNSRLPLSPRYRTYDAVITTYLKPWWMP